MTLICGSHFIVSHMPKEQICIKNNGVRLPSPPARCMLHCGMSMVVLGGVARSNMDRNMRVVVGLFPLLPHMCAPVLVTDGGAACEGAHMSCCARTVTW